jgi:hypothetical protein
MIRFVVCMRVGDGDDKLFNDNVYGRCAECEHPIYYRPNNPKRPPKICVQCAIEKVEHDRQDQPKAC